MNIVIYVIFAFAIIWLIGGIFIFSSRKNYCLVFNRGDVKMWKYLIDHYKDFSYICTYHPSHKAAYDISGDVHMYKAVISDMVYRVHVDEKRVGVFAISATEDSAIVDDSDDEEFVELNHMVYSELILTDFEKPWADEFITLLQLN